MPAAHPDASLPIRLRLLGTVPYDDALQRMRDWTTARQTARTAHRHAPERQGTLLPHDVHRDWPSLDEAAHADDEIWLMQHPPVFTLGMNSRPEHLLDAGNIPVVRTERGGQITYHGPGQIMGYVMLDLRRRRLGIRALVNRLEEGLINCLRQYGIHAFRQDGAPGIYVLRLNPTHATSSTAPASSLPDGHVSPVPGLPHPVQAAPGKAQSSPSTTRPTCNRSAHRRPARSAQPAPHVAKIASIGLKTSHGLSYHGLALNGQMDLSPFQRIEPCGFRNLQMTDMAHQMSPRQDLNLDTLALTLGTNLAAALEG